MIARNWVGISLLTLAALLAPGGRSQSQTTQPSSPNIVIILADDLGYGDLGCQGAVGFQTPNIDRMAREGIRFTNFRVAQPVCTASRAALLTGCYPNRIGLEGALNHTSLVGINSSETLLSELCRSRGWATAIFGKWHLGHRPIFHPSQHGFDEYFGIPYSNDNGPFHPTLKNLPALSLYDGEKIAELDPDQSRFTRRFTDRALAFIESCRERKQSFFLYLPHVMPHVPIFASTKYRGKSQRGLYGDVVEELDASVGEILEKLKRRGLDQNTLVFFLSDNGPFLSYGEHAGSAGPLREGKLSTWEGGVRVPCIAWWPGHIPAGIVSDTPWESIDLLPTIAALIGAEAPPNSRIDGRDVRPLLLGAKEAPDAREAFYYYAGQELQAVRWGDWKLHFPHEYLTVDGEPGKGGKPANFGKLKPVPSTQSGLAGIASRHGYKIARTGLALYDLKHDPGEQRNLVSEEPDIAKKIQALADLAREDLGDTLSGRMGGGMRPVGMAPEESKQ